jgi:hypothetical protein
MIEPESSRTGSPEKDPANQPLPRSHKPEDAEIGDEEIGLEEAEDAKPNASDP